MKLAIINYRFLFDEDTRENMNRFASSLKERGIESDVESTLKYFEGIFGSLDN